MITFKCKMCGGDLTFEPGASVAECPYCGTNQTLPKLDDDKRANLYDRANHFRRQNEFDKAMAIYEQVLAEDRTDAEAYWSLVLCRYGIEYVEDPASHKRVPTVNRVQYASILADEDYKSALAHADAVQRRVYEAEANAIAEIQKGILDISRKEAPFDVFICYKETDANGRRTPDSVLANDMYHQLTKEGFKVFFSRITLEDKIGTAYEPYIFAALNSAKVMVVLGTKPEYFNAVWVKNEWSRYLALIRNGADKILVPAYRDMDPYDLPEEFAHLQAQDMSKLGFMQDLIRGIKKILHKDEPKPQTAAQPAATAPANNVAPLLKRAFMFLEDGDFARADDFCEQVLNLDPENGRAYLGKLMVDLQVRRESDLKNLPQPFDRESNYQKIMRFGDEALKKQVQGDIEFINNRNEHARQKVIFDNASKTLEKASTVWQCGEAISGFESILGFEGVEQKLAESKAKIEAINERDYNKAKQLQNEGKWEEAIKAFDRLGDYRDSKQQTKKCREAKAVDEEATQQRMEQARLQAEAKAKEEAAKKKKTTIISVVAVVLVIAAVLLYVKVIKPNSTYNSALSAMKMGNYDEAIKAFESLGEYKDAVTRIKQVEADKLYDTGSYSEAMAVYNTLDEAYHSHAVDYKQMYADAEKKMNDGDYDGATTAFAAISGYGDADIQALESQYKKGEALQTAEAYDAAINTFSELKEYKDSTIRATQTEADSLFADGFYDKAYAIYAKLSEEYQTHAADYAQMYADAQAHLAKGEYDDASALFGGLGEYRDAATQALDSQYQKGEALYTKAEYAGAYKAFSGISEYKDADKRANQALADQYFSAGSYDEAYAIYDDLDDAYQTHASDYEQMYSNAKKLLDEKDYSKAGELFIGLGGYSDAATMSKECQYQNGVALLASNDYDGAKEAFDSVSDYKDSSTKAMESQYNKGMSLLKAGSFDEAASIFQSIRSFSDSETMALECQYQKGMTLLSGGKYDEAITTFQSIPGYSDADTMIEEGKYQKALTLCSNGKYDEAYALLLALGEYSDAKTQALETKYKKGFSLLDSGHQGEAFLLFASIKDYSDASDQMKQIASQMRQNSKTIQFFSKMIATGYQQTAAIKADGTVLAAGYYNSSRLGSIADWEDVVQVSVDEHCLAGLKADGTVLCTLNSHFQQKDIADWDTIVAIDTAFDTIKGLMADGSVVAAGDYYTGENDISTWKDIVAVAEGYAYSVGLKADGTVKAVGYVKRGACDVSGWKDIVDIDAGHSHTVGLKENGTVVAAIDDNEFDNEGQCKVSEWKDIVAIAAGYEHTVGLRADGTVVAVGDNDNGQCNVSEWKDIIAIAAGSDGTVGLRVDGSLVYTGRNEKGEGDISDWLLW